MNKPLNLAAEIQRLFFTAPPVKLCAHCGKRPGTIEGYLGNKFCSQFCHDEHKARMSK